MAHLDDDSLDLLKQARAKAAALVDEMIRQRDQLQQNPPDIALDKMEQGRVAMDRALASAQRALAAMEAALAIAEDTSE